MVGLEAAGAFSRVKGSSRFVVMFMLFYWFVVLFAAPFFGRRYGVHQGGRAALTKRRPKALLLGNYSKPMNLNIGEEPILIGHELFSGLTVHVGLAGGFIIEGIENEI